MFFSIFVFSNSCCYLTGYLFVGSFIDYPCLLICLGLAKLTTDPRLTIRKGALEVLFDILKDHGHIFSPPFWASIFESVIYPIFTNKPDGGSDSNTEEEPSGALETQTLASRCLVDLYCEVFDAVRPELSQVMTIVVGFIKSPYQQAATAGVAQLQRLTENLGGELNGSE